MECFLKETRKIHGYPSNNSCFLKSGKEEKKYDVLKRQSNYSDECIHAIHLALILYY